MKKLMALAVVLAMVFSGCCSLTAPDGTVTKSAANCLKTAQTTVCNAPASVVSQLDAVLSLVELAIGTFVPGTAPYIAAVSAFGSAASIQAGICVSLTQLNALIAFLQDPQVTALQTQLMMKKGPMKATVINIQPFVDWRNGGK